MLADLLKQKAELEAQILAHQTEARASAIATIKQLMHDNGLTYADVGIEMPPQRRAKLLTGGPRAKSGDARTTVLPKFKGPEGQLWSGRGQLPRWVKDELIKGKTLDSFRI